MDEKPDEVADLVGKFVAKIPSGMRQPMQELERVLLRTRTTKCGTAAKRTAERTGEVGF